MKRARVPALFADDSDDDSEEAAPKRSIRAVQQKKKAKEDVEEEGDPLDAYMNKLNAGLSQQGTNEARSESESSEERVVQKSVAHEEEKEEERERDGERLARDLVLEPVDHSVRKYIPIVKCEYRVLPHLTQLDDEERKERLAELKANVRGGDAVPIQMFQDLALTLEKGVLGATLASFEMPTPIQQLAIPAILRGLNVIGVAKTGSGKTAAYAIPLLNHVCIQPKGSSVGGKGPSALIVAPTRELALQLAGVVKTLGEGVGVGVMCVVGGHAKYEQFKRLRDGGGEVVVCTPGRMIDMLKMKACSLARCSFVVLDEADRMLDLGFEQQVRGVLGQIRPDAQRVLFSATFPSSVAALVKSYVEGAVRISIGENEGRKNVQMVSENVTQVYVVLETEIEKQSWLLEKLEGLLRDGLVIVFCNSRGAAASLANVVRQGGLPAACIHGETDHGDREGLLKMFRGGELPLLVTTDLWARGLDVANVNNVINFGCAKSWEWHVHRVGRTGRAKEKGTAYTLINRNSRTDAAFVAEAVGVYRAKHLQVPEQLAELTKRDGRDGCNSSKRFRGRRRFR